MHIINPDISRTDITMSKLWIKENLKLATTNMLDFMKEVAEANMILQVKVTSHHIQLIGDRSDDSLDYV